MVTEEPLAFHSFSTQIRSTEDAHLNAQSRAEGTGISFFLPAIKASKAD
jgi:hypothetical protein